MQLRMSTHILRHTPPLGLHLQTHKRYHVSLHTPSPIRKSIKHIYDNRPEFDKATQHLTHLPFLEHRTDLTCWEVLELVQVYPMASSGGGGVTTIAPCTTTVWPFESLLDYERLHPIQDPVLRSLYASTVEHIQQLLKNKENESKAKELLYVMEGLWKADRAGRSVGHSDEDGCCGRNKKYDVEARCHSDDN